MSKYPVFLAGMRATADLLTSSQPDVVTKTATESVTSSTTLQDDDELFVSVEANATYVVDMMLIHSSATAGDIKIGWSVPAGASFSWTGQGASNTATSSFTVADSNMAGRNAAESLEFGGGAGTATRADVSGTLITSATAGALQFQWAQRVSDATATQVRAGTWLSVRRTA
ncbi:hypothetical protein [Streptomyces sp. NPDC057426]|uniref:hypothetical protein n=1 Tax=Streptomyces sp. NPDC057426 TaxID=3346128 RepID=UPI0036B5209E